MNARQILIASGLAALLALTAGGSYWLGSQRGAVPDRSGAAATPATASAGGEQAATDGEDATRRHLRAGLKAGDTDPVSGRKILYYHDPMVPAQRFDRPGKSPFMDMMLVPVFAGAQGDQGTLSISPRVQQNLGVRTALATEGPLAPELMAVGSIAYNERDQAVVQARAGAFVERLAVRATLDGVRAGQVLAELYVPDWVAVQEEFVALRRMQGRDLEPLLEAARARMRQAGMGEEMIRRVEATGRTDARIRILAPITGLVTEIGAREGMAVMPGSTLFRINGFGTVWAHAEVPESQAHLLRRGGRVVAETPMAPGVQFEGRVQQLVPAVDADTRTIKARVELSNRDAFLVPGMFVRMRFTEPARGRGVLVPSEAVIHTGRRTVVLLAEDNGQFRAQEVEAGIEAGEQTQIKSGLAPGQRVVVSSQFLIDSEASLRGFTARLHGAATGAVQPGMPAPAAQARKLHQGTARVEAVEKDALTLSHGPIPSIQWGPMTMDFNLPAGGSGVPIGLKAGDEIGFEFFMDKEGLPELTRVWRAGSPPAAVGAGGGKP